jgi:HPt (histidine-containing phosphotransfer) domain-containing protein
MELRRLAERLGLDDVELKEVMRLFVESSTADIESFASAVRTGDSARAAAAIHSIKGAALCLGLNDISRAAREVELRSRQGCLDGLAEAAAAIKRNIEKISGYIGER